MCYFVTVNVYVPKDRVTNLHQGYGFVEFRSEEDADYVSFLLGAASLGSNLVITVVAKIQYIKCFYFLFCCLVQAIKVLNMLKLYGKPIRVNKVHILNPVCNNIVLDT